MFRNLKQEYICALSSSKLDVGYQIQIIFTILQGTIVVTLTSTSASVAHLKVLRQMCFYVMGKALSGELSCMGTGLV